jgi:predicted transcriptional regulator
LKAKAMTASTESRALLFSIKPKWADAIISGEKTFELRRRPPKLTSPVSAIIYATAPVCALVAKCSMGPVLSGPPMQIWDRVSVSSSVTQTEFDDYFRGCWRAHAIVVSNPRKLAKPLSLGYLRDTIRFSAPQAWVWASKDIVIAAGLNA